MKSIQYLCGALMIGVCSYANAGVFSWLKAKSDPAVQTHTETQTSTLNVSQTRQIVVHDDTGNHDDHTHEIPRQVGTESDYQLWLNEKQSNRQTATAYQQFLTKHLGANNVPPMRELLTTARSWQECGYDPYQVPPSELWGQMLPTIRLYNELRQRGILPPQTQIRSVYRNPELNRCAGGANGSKHMTNGAMDIWVPDYVVDSWQMSNLQDKLCQFWIDEGKPHGFGLGIYATGAIHLDTQGYRKWGGQFSRSNSPCRYIPPKPEALYIDGYGWAD